MTNKPTNKPHFGLQELPEDSRDLVLSTFGALPTELPDSFSLPERAIKNQDTYFRGSDFCAGYASALASEWQENEELLAEPTWAYSKQGNEEAWGQNLRSACRAHQKFGAVSKKDFDLSVIPQDKLRYFSAYPDYLTEKAGKHKKQTYVKLNSFDEICQTLYKYQDRAVVMGLIWAWSLSQYELTGTQDKGFGHAVCAVAFDRDWLIIQNSYGESAGKRGRHRVSRETVDHFVKRFGAYAFIDMPVEEAKKQHERAVLYHSSWLKRLFISLYNSSYNLCRVYGIGVKYNDK